MEENKNLNIESKPIVWASFLDEKDKEIQGFFRLLEFSNNYVKLISGKNIGA